MNCTNCIYYKFDAGTYVINDRPSIMYCHKLVDEWKEARKLTKATRFNITNLVTGYFSILEICKYFKENKMNEEILNATKSGPEIPSKVVDHQSLQLKQQIKHLNNDKCEIQTLARLISKIIREKPIGWEKVINTLLKQITKG